MATSDIAEAYRIIATDESFHRIIGRCGLQTFAVGLDDQRRALAACKEIRRLDIEAWQGIYGDLAAYGIDGSTLT